MTYNGFISYSHAADDLLAPRLQSALQRFAKPWWKRRALRIFRDESSLSANPHLWESITGALDQSEWFVLLLSPEAAQSEWVGNEVAYWVEHKDPSRILPVVTAGEFGWDGDVAGDAVPDALRGAFPAEPRWVDLRFAKSDQQLDVKDPRFADAVADLASTMRGVAKDELAGEEVRQYRRTVRTAWGAGVVLVLALGAAMWAGVVASQNAVAEAEARAEAETQRALAEQAAAEADRQRGEAIAAGDRAEEQADLAQSIAERVVESVMGGWEADLLRPSPVNAIPLGAQPLGVAFSDDLPASLRMDFLQQYCVGGTCGKAPSVVDLDRGLRTLFFVGVPNAYGAWLADEPFHVRHGFRIPDGAASQSMLTAGYSVSLYITKEGGPQDDVLTRGSHYAFEATSLFEGRTDRCGPRETVGDGLDDPCLQWVFDFPTGLSSGVYEMWVVWEAPCEAWFEIDVCQSPSRVASFLSVGAEMYFVSEQFGTQRTVLVGGWPWDPWANAEPIPEVTP